MTDPGPTEDSFRRIGAQTVESASSVTGAGPAEDRFRRIVTGVIVVGVTLFVVGNLRPWTWFLDTTPTGGDLGAHVWAPAYLRDVLLGDLRLTGWAQDWYAGFPAFTFYMVIPSLLVVMVETGVGLPVAVIAGLAAVAMAGLGMRRPSGSFGRLRELVRWARLPAGAAAGAVVVLVISVPYGVAFKLVAIAGLVALPAAVWLMARLGGLAFPGPALAAAGAVPFIFDQSFNIYGGNLMSTMSGEFAYSLGLLVAVLYMGMVAQGLTTGGRRVVAGALLALTALTHLFVVILAVAFTLAFLPAARIRDRLRWVLVAGPLAGLLSAWWVLPFLWNRGLLNDMGWFGRPGDGSLLRTRISSEYGPALWSRTSLDYDFLANDPPFQIFVIMALAGAVLCTSRRLRQFLGLNPDRVRFGMALALTGLLTALTFVLMNEASLLNVRVPFWNVRILPFYYFSVYIMAAIGLSEASQSAGRLASAASRRLRSRTAVAPGGPEPGEPAEPDQVPGADQVVADPAGPVPGAPPRWLPTAVAGAVAAVGVAVMLVMVGLPLRALPGGRVNAEGLYQWGPLQTEQFNLGGYWVEYNFEGYEHRDPTEGGGGASEYFALVDAMAEVGREHGCGRSLWEYGKERLGSYGTPMALMLLPYWTDGCVGSMEGLYFEASATTPYHFLMQSELSAFPSRSQRDLPYRYEVDVAAGVDHLQRMGVRYYLAFSEPVLEQAQVEPDLREVTRSGPWVVFEVADSDLVVGLDELPVVVDDFEGAGYDWLEVSVGAFQIPAGPVLAADGPDGWPTLSLAEFDEGAEPAAPRAFPTDRVEVIRALSDRLAEAAPRRPVEPAAVSAVTWGQQSISFRVDRTGSPVLVRASYFPNWSVTGADGPYRVTPNLMAVVPTEEEVTLEYGRSPVELLALLLTLAGLAWAGWLTWRTRPKSGPVRRLSVVIPAYREVNRIESTVAALRSGLAEVAASGGVEIIVVDDGSDDGTADAARRAGPDVVIELPANQGKGAAVRAGVRAATGATVAFTDADLSYRPEHLIRVVSAVEAGCDMAIGNRYLPEAGAKSEPSRLRWAGSRVVNLLARRVLGIDCRDTQCGVKAFRADAARTLMEAGVIDGFAFDIELLHLAGRYEFNLREVPVEADYRSASGDRRTSTVGLGSGLAVIRDILKIGYRARRGLYPPTHD